MLQIDTIDPRRPVLIAGPTASGKSALAMRIAGPGSVVVNADALQVWDCWRVLSARPAPEDEARVPHALYGHKSPGDDYSVGHWLRDLALILADFRQGGPRPVIVGGTGLYLSALTEGLAEIPATPPAIRAEADARLADRGLAAMVAELDRATAARTDLLNPARVQRAWEVLRATGRGLAEWQAAGGHPLLPLAQAEALRIDADRDWLAQRIDSRFSKMITEGALEEAGAILPVWDPAAPWAKAIGAPELVAHHLGKMSLADAISAGQLATRQYAKRQRTWLRSRMRGWKPLSLP
jgi:tRNA dimethylallyltransferase